MQSFFVTLALAHVHLSASFSVLPLSSHHTRSSTIGDNDNYHRDQQSHTLNYAKEIDTISPDSFNCNENYPQTSQDEEIAKAKNNSNKKLHKKKKTSKQQQLWNTRYEELVGFYNVNGHSNVPYNHPNHKLSRWVTNQRQNKKLRKRCMTKERIDALNDVEFTFTTRSTWEDRFNELKEFSLIYGHCKVSSSTNHDLSRFVASQRRQHRLYLEEKGKPRMSILNDCGKDSSNNSSSMTEEREQALVSIGFEFDNKKSSNDSAWEAKYNQLKQYQQSQNNCLVPSNDVNLRRWVDSQRTAYRLSNEGAKSSFTQGRIDLLNRINFEWDPIDARFNEWVKQLKEFQKENQHCNVPIKTNPSLHSWIKRQRDQYQNYIGDQNSSLTKEKINLLINLGLELERKNDGASEPHAKTPWIEKFHQLQEYKNANGHCIVPQKHLQLGKFVRAQRNSHRLMLMGKKSSMTQQRIDKLNSIGFVWNVSSIQNKRKYSSADRAVMRGGMNSRAHSLHMARTAQATNSRSYSNSEDLLHVIEMYGKKSLWGYQ